jgi:CRISPR/Cas system-associated endonuclease Cas1
MHADLRARDSLACDLMEVIRPQADEFVLELIRNRKFRKRGFFETREGICRILPPLNHEIAQTVAKWRKLIGPIAEKIAQRLFKSASKHLNRSFLNGAAELILPIAKDRLPTP